MPLSKAPEESLTGIHGTAAEPKFGIRINGPSVAKNVRVSFTPEIPDPLAERAEQSIIPFLQARYAMGR